MSENDTADDLVTAWLDRDPKALDRCADRDWPAPTDQQALRWLVDHLPGTGQAPDTDPTALDAVLSDDLAPVLQTLILDVVALGTISRPQHATFAQSLRRRMQRCLDLPLPPDAVAILQYRSSALSSLLREEQTALDLARAGLAAARHASARVHAAAAGFHPAINLGLEQQASEFLGIIEAEAVLARRLGFPVAEYRWQWEVIFGDAHACLERLQRGPVEGMAEVGRLICLVNTLHILRRPQDALRMLARLKALAATDQANAATIDYLDLYSLYQCRRYDAARHRLGGIQSTIDGPLRDDVRQIALMLALAEGRRDEASSLLLQLDPQQDRPFMLMEWVRLRLLDGKEAEAAAVFARLLACFPMKLLRIQFMLAHEVGLDAIAALTLAATQAGQPPAVPPPPQQTPADGVDAFVGRSPAAGQVRSAIAVMAPLDAPLLITGETGTGKEVVAQLLHRLGGRAQRPFVALNCAALPAALAESELFGHEKGSFTGASASSAGLIATAGDGTLFLDEINSMPLPVQGLLLRVLELGDYRPVGGRRSLRAACRFVLASNQPLDGLVAEGRFREDLLYRLRRLAIDIPPLRQRADDIPDLCAHILGQFDASGVARIEPDLMTLLQRHAWPGNVRELRNEIERLVLLNGGTRRYGLAQAAVLSPGLRTGLVPAKPQPQPRGRGKVAAAGAYIHGPPRARQRRQRILELFAAQPHVYQKDVIEATGSAASTAAGDLRALVGLGLIRRVVTSGHHSTSYYVAVEAAEGMSP